MARLAELLDFVDGIRPNAFTQSQKLQWLNELEGTIQQLIFHRTQDETVRYRLPDDSAQTLLAPFPHDKLYWAYLCAMIDFGNGEYSKYQNSMMMFNSAYSDYEKWFMRANALTYAHRPSGTTLGSTGPRGKDGLSAYEIAVQNGFSGSEAQWLDSLRGADGADGASGQSASISIGGVETLEPGESATAVNTGTPLHAVLQFGIPRGAPGSGADLDTSQFAPIDSPAFTSSISLNRKPGSAAGRNSSAVGMMVQASADFSHAEGAMTTASGTSAHAEGMNTTASGAQSHAEGGQSAASARFSHAEGTGTTASGEQSHAEGFHTKAAGTSQHVQGKYNLEDTANLYAHIVGGGASESKRANLHTLDWKGNAWFSGDVTDGGGNVLSDIAARLAALEHAAGLE